MAARNKQMTFDTTEFEAGLKRLTADMEVGAERSLRAFAADGEKFVRSGTPARSGELRESVTSDVKRDLLGWTAEISVGKFYASFFEWGTRFIPARPFFRPGVEKAMDTLRTQLRRIL